MTDSLVGVFRERVAESLCKRARSEELLLAMLIAIRLLEKQFVWSNNYFCRVVFNYYAKTCGNPTSLV